MLKERSAVQEIVGDSAAIRKIKETIDKWLPTDARILITGENSGKELWPDGYMKKQPQWRPHGGSEPSRESLIESELFGHEKGYTSAIKQRIGKFEQANGGTLFLMRLVI